MHMFSRAIVHNDCLFIVVVVVDRKATNQFKMIILIIAIFELLFYRFSIEWSQVVCILQIHHSFLVCFGLEQNKQTAHI